MKKYGMLLFLLVFALMFCACGGSEQETMEAAETKGAENTADMFSDRDQDPSYDESTCVKITLNGTSVSCDSDAVEISGTMVTITDEGTYLLSGTLSDGMIIVDAEDTDKPQLVLDGVSVTSETSAALYILEADKVFLTLAKGSESTLTNGGTFTSIDDNNIDGALFSKQDLTINGSGSLAVSSPGGHGIVCKDDLVFTGGATAVTSSSHGLDVNDSLRVTAASLAIAAGKDGIHAENSDDTSLGFVYIADGTFDISAEGDGISAGSYLQIDDGTFDIVTGGGSENAAQQTSESWGMHGGGMGGPGGDPGMGGGRGGGTPGAKPTSAADTSAEAETNDAAAESTSIKGLKSTGDLMIFGGTITIDSADDSVHSNASVTIGGGTLELASGDDGIHADDTLTVADGTINITESYEGLEALHIAIGGGEITAVCSDDGLNAAGGTDASGYGGQREPDEFGGGRGNSDGTIVISGGSLNLTASGDGIDANGSLEISGGYTVVSGPTAGDTATLDYDTEAVITGGTFIGTGASQMAQTFSDSEQGVIALSVGDQAAGTEILITDSSGNEMLSYTPELNFGVMIFSSPDLKKGDTYTVTVGSSSGEFEAY